MVNAEVHSAPHCGTPVGKLRVISVDLYVAPSLLQVLRLLFAFCRKQRVLTSAVSCHRNLVGGANESVPPVVQQTSNI